MTKWTTPELNALKRAINKYENNWSEITAQVQKVNPTRTRIQTKGKGYAIIQKLKVNSSLSKQKTKWTQPEPNYEKQHPSEPPKTVKRKSASIDPKVNLQFHISTTYLTYLTKYRVPTLSLRKLAAQNSSFICH